MTRIPDPADPFEEDGLPATDEQGWPGKQITGDAQEGMAPPAERPTYVDGWGTTAAEQARPEPLEHRLLAEEPDVLARSGDPADESPGADSPTPTDPEERVGRLVEPDEGARPDAEPDLVAGDVGTDTGGFSAEERAVHLEEG